MRKELASVSVDHKFHKVATDLLRCLGNLKWRIVKLYAGMTGEYVVIRTNAPDSIIIQQIRANNLASESGQTIRNDFSFLEDEGYMVDVICKQDDDCDIEPDAEFDGYRAAHS